MKILLLGKTGMLGTDCHNILSKNHEIIAPDRNELDIISWDRVIELLNTISPDIVINCAGFTDVDKCETEDFTVRKVNVEGPRNLAQGSARFNSKLIHISTDYVFNGQKNIPQPYFEDDAMEPISAYGKSKVESEVGVKENAPDYIIIRTAWLYGLGGANFITSIIKATLDKRRKIIKVADDQVGSPTWTNRLAIQIRELMSRNLKGTYHATTEGYCSRYEFAKFIVEKLRLGLKVEPIKMKDFKQAAKRPANCILENRLLKKQGINLMPPWEKDLEIFLDKFGDKLIADVTDGKY